MKKTITLFIILNIIFTSTSFANTIFDIPLWSKDKIDIEVSNESFNENFLNLESESAILIEQSTRKNII